MNFEIEVDGGIDDQTIAQAKEAGATVFVAGSYVFKGDVNERVQTLRKHWTRVAVFAGGDRGHYRTDFDCFVGVDRGSLWVLEEKLPLALAVGDFDSVTAEERQVIQKTCPAFLFKPDQKR